MKKISLKAAVADSGMTQADLAKQMGVTRQAIWLRIKNYRTMRAKDLIKFCKIIKFNINNLDFGDQ